MGENYRLLMYARNRGMAHALKRAGKSGYRAIAAADPSINAPAMVLVEAAVPSETYAYRVVTRPVRRQRRGKLQEKLNRAGIGGYRLVPESSTDTVLVLERAPGPTTDRCYRAVGSRTPPGFPRALEDASREGFRFIMMFADAEEVIVLLDRPSTCPGPG